MPTNHAPLEVPPLRSSFVLTRTGQGRGFEVGRAGMLYRDLIPDRQGGRFIASHILIPDGGPVPDYVHFHRVRLQVIYCYRGWVRVVYEDQGPPFVMQPGDCVLQPPGIRHRVLECAPRLEVVEVACPAEYETLADPELELPTRQLQPDRDFEGQRFSRHEAAGGSFVPWRSPGLESRDLGIASATRGLASARVVRPRRPHEGRAPEAEFPPHAAELAFSFVLEGSATLCCESQDSAEVSAGDAFVIPAGKQHALRGFSPDLELLVVALPSER